MAAPPDATSSCSSIEGAEASGGRSEKMDDHEMNRHSACEEALSLPRRARSSSKAARKHGGIRAIIETWCACRSGSRIAARHSWTRLPGTGWWRERARRHIRWRRRSALIHSRDTRPDKEREVPAPSPLSPSLPPPQPPLLPPSPPPSLLGGAAADVAAATLEAATNATCCERS